ncbi:MAG: hypothetical protein PVI30_19125 [Myxococcales bacterium]
MFGRLATLACWLIVVNALDLSTSLSPHGADHVTPLPQKPGWLWALQLALLPGLVWVALRLRPHAERLWNAVPASTPVKIVIAAVLAVQYGHVAFRAEHYPFSPVTMFSTYEPTTAVSSMRRVRTFMVDTPSGPEPLSMLREGNPYFARYLGLDYKAGWVLGTFGDTDAQTRAHVREMLREAGADNPRMVTIELSTVDGSYRVVSSEPPAGEAQQP